MFGSYLQITQIDYIFCIELKMTQIHIVRSHYEVTSNWAVSLQRLSRYSGYIRNTKKFKMPQLTTPQMLWAIGLLQAGMSKRHFAEQFGCTQSTMPNLIRRYTATGSPNDHCW